MCVLGRHGKASESRTWEKGLPDLQTINPLALANHIKGKVIDGRRSLRENGLQTIITPTNAGVRGQIKL